MTLHSISSQACMDASFSSTTLGNTTLEPNSSRWHFVFCCHKHSQTCFTCGKQMILLSACLGAKTCSKVMMKDEELLAPLSVHDIGHFFLIYSQI